MILALVGGILALCGAIRHGKSGGSGNTLGPGTKPIANPTSFRSSPNAWGFFSLEELYQTDWPLWDRFALVIIAVTALTLSVFLGRELMTGWGWFTFWLVLMGAGAGLGGLIFKDRLRLSAKYFAFAGIAFHCIAFLTLSILFPLVPAWTRQPSGIQRQIAVQAKAEPKRISDISYYDVQSKFVDPKGLTDAQKPREWPKYKGKWVSWSGTVAQVRDRSGGRVSLVVDMGSSLTGHDVTVELGRISRERAIRLSKGEFVQFIGKLDSQPGYFMGITLSEGLLMQDVEQRASPKPISANTKTQQVRRVLQDKSNLPQCIGHCDKLYPANSRQREQCYDECASEEDSRNLRR